MDILMVILGSIAIIAVVLIVAIYKITEYFTMKEIIKNIQYLEHKDEYDEEI